MGKRILIVTDRIGRGDDDLGRVLMRSFLYALARDEARPESIMLMNEGVRLACEGSTSLDDLNLLVDRGVAISACGTCLDYLGLTDAQRVGVVGAMTGTVASLLGDDQIVTIA